MLSFLYKVQLAVSSAVCPKKRDIIDTYKSYESNNDAEVNKNKFIITKNKNFNSFFLNSNKKKLNYISS